MEAPDSDEVDKLIKDPNFEIREMMNDYGVLFSHRKIWFPIVWFIIGVIPLILLLKLNNGFSVGLFVLLGAPSLAISLGYCLWPFTARILLPLIIIILGVAKLLLFWIPMYVFATIKIMITDNLDNQTR